MVKTDDIIKYLQDNLSDKRYRHSLGVADEAVKLADIYGADREKAYLAGLVHDCAKEIKSDEALRLLKDRYCVVPDTASVLMPNLLHGILGAYMARSEFGIEDADIFDAVRYHTTGKANMNLLSRIIYIADFIEPNRDFDSVDELRALTYRDIDEAIIVGIDFTICDLIKRGQIVHPDTMDCRNDLIIKRQRDDKRHRA